MYVWIVAETKNKIIVIDNHVFLCKFTYVIDRIRNVDITLPAELCINDSVRSEKLNQWEIIANKRVNSLKLIDPYPNRPEWYTQIYVYNLLKLFLNYGLG